MKIIPVDSKKYGYHEIFVDDEDFDLVSQYTWSLRKGRNNTFYAQSMTYLKEGKRKLIKMHRLILGLTDPKIKGDHQDHNGLNNQRYNIRGATNSQNCMNKICKKNSTSKYLGVCLITDNRTNKNYKYWIAQIRINGKQEHLGYFKNEEDAAKEYDKHALIHHKEFANLNFPQHLIEIKS